MNHGPGRSVPIEVAVLDLVGTTVDDHDLVRSAIQSATGDRFDEQVFTRFRGASKPDLLTALVGTDDTPRALERFEASAHAAIDAGGVEPLPHAASCLEQLHDRGLRTCLVTGFSRPLREALLEQLGWTELVDLALSPEDVGRGRPAPDLVLTAALRLQASDVRAVAAVGDTTNDIFSAFHAGCDIRAAVLTGAHNAAALRAAPVTHLLGDISEFPDVLSRSA